ncbi:16S rRNA (guanine(966)-N(2))-methyltransferase RsmD [Loktanella sp. TSTF-M6]|uniref:16S rRNA (Guanine(966)-N(2))-methyltransferase RsmD n=1 Tax=Loktanella gaetbuli TaxID=2881335 RepID=A0ABS8BSV6_9RHOB|nr:16S rRNA (guanine(966)-N(2))-methyltransferase RsmD [Loktanella gaetbuli]MCB5198822.1 16S rRNA (guanine(966)-N(2))-methyltransferase RsmD [Loktanella gaetbuli]
MRIVAGLHRGTQLADVGGGDPAAHLRPTSDRVRESLFNVLDGGRFGSPVRGARVLDLFAGTGALGLEALSRGAQHATFVDNGAAAGRLLQANIAKLKRRADTAIIKADATAIPMAHTACNLIFIDPPYGQGLGLQAILASQEGGWIAAGALIVWEESTAQMAPRGYKRLDQRQYGSTWITLLEAP